MNILFVCSRNKWRSRTAEEIYKDVPGYRVRSAGVHPSAKVRLNEKHLSWADLVFVMEKEQKKIIAEKFHNTFDASRVIVLDIPDEYQFMDEDLILSLKNGVAPYLQEK